MKNRYIFLSAFLCCTALTYHINAANQAQELNTQIQEDLSKLETDIKRAEEYHQTEQKYLEMADTKRAMEEDKTREAAALFEMIKEEAEQNKPVTQESSLQATQEVNLDDVLKDLNTVNTTEEEILKEQALQGDIQEALKTANDIETA